MEDEDKYGLSGSMFSPYERREKLSPSKKERFRPPKRKQRLGQYPTHWLKLVSRVGRGAEVLLEFSTWTEASNFRFRFYGFREALETEARINPTFLPSLGESELVLCRLQPIKECPTPNNCSKRWGGKQLCDSCKGPTRLLFQNRALVSEGAILSKALNKEKPKADDLIKSLLEDPQNA